MIKKFNPDKNCEIRIEHNQISGAKKIFGNENLLIDVKSDFFEKTNSHQIQLCGIRYALTISPNWYGTFSYELRKIDDFSLEDKLLCVSA